MMCRRFRGKGEKMSAEGNLWKLY